MPERRPKKKKEPLEKVYRKMKRIQDSASSSGDYTKGRGGTGLNEREKTRTVVPTAMPTRGRKFTSKNYEGAPKRDAGEARARGRAILAARSPRPKKDPRTITIGKMGVTARANTSTAGDSLKGRGGTGLNEKPYEGKRPRGEHQARQERLGGRQAIFGRRASSPKRKYGPGTGGRYGINNYEGAPKFRSFGLERRTTSTSTPGGR